MSISKSCALCATALLLIFGAQSAAAAAPEVPGTTFAASSNAAGDLADGSGVAEYTSVGISEDGRYVAFQSAAQNLGEAGPPGVVEGFVKNLETGRVELVSRADGLDGLDGEPAATSITTLELSGDGRHVLFTTAATNLGTTLPGERPGEEAHVYERDLDTGVTTLVDRVSGTEGQILARGAEGDSISADGEVVAFTDLVANLEDPLGDHAETAEAVGYVRDLASGETTAVSRASGVAGELADRGAAGLSLSPDGRYVSFSSSATNLGDPAEFFEEYLRDTATETTSLLGRSAAGEPPNLRVEGGNFSAAAGCYVELSSTATNLLEPELPGLTGNQAYVYDRCGGAPAVALASLDEAGEPFAQTYGGYEAPTVTADGEEAIFAGETAAERTFHLYLRDFGTRTTSIVDRASGSTGSPANAQVQYFAISASGCRVAFSTTATNLAAEAAPGVAEGLEPTELYIRQLAPCHEEAKTPAAAAASPPPPAAAVVPRATKVTVGHLGRKALWLVFDGAGQARVRIQVAVAGRHHGWQEVRALTARAAAAGSVKVPLPRLRTGRYRLKLRLQGDPDNPTLTKRLRVGGP